MLYKLTRNVETTIPTIGFNIEHVPRWVVMRGLWGFQFPVFVRFFSVWRSKKSSTYKEYLKDQPDLGRSEKMFLKMVVPLGLFFLTHELWKAKMRLEGYL